MQKWTFLLTLLTVVLTTEQVRAVVLPNDSVAAVLVPTTGVHTGDSGNAGNAGAGAASATKRSPWTAGIEVAALNLVVMGYDHLISREVWYHVTLRSIQRNLPLSHWQWDGDFFHTNTINHTYHGSLYYSAARSNGMDIAPSALYTLGGSLTWEVFCESEKPSVNDIITTPIGGVTLGEPLHRVTTQILDDGARGLERVGREVLAAVLSPMRGLNRVISGDAWRVSHRPATARRASMHSGLLAGVRRLSVSDKHAFSDASLRWDVVYGDVMGSEGNGLFDYFTLDVTGTFGHKQFPLSDVSVKSQLWSRLLCNRELAKVAVGLYNHYDYMYALPDYELRQFQRKAHPYGYIEVGAVGPGVACRLGDRTRWEQQLHLTGIALGATPSDLVHPNNSNKGYSYGSGYGARLSTSVEARQWLRLQVDGRFSQLFTWDGFYADDPARQRSQTGYSVQGERGNVVTLTIAPSVELMPFGRVGIGLHCRWFRCHSNYKFHPHDTSTAWQWQAGLRVEL